jgi:hypothetical protein
VKEINNYVIEEFVSKIYAAQKTNQKTVTLDIKEAQNIAQNLTIILARAVGVLDRAVQEVPEQQISIGMDGGSL